jgi:hypothetical protein
MTTVLRMLLLVAMPLGLAVVLWFHPGGGDPVYEGVRDDVDAWVFVHTVLLVALPLLALAVFLLLDGVQSLAATVSRVSLVVFCVFYTAYEVTVGLATGILVDHANGLPAAEQAAVGDAIQTLNESNVLGDPMSISLAAGLLGWVVALVAAAVALRKAGAGWAVTILVGLASFVAIHPPPIGPVALVLFATAGALVERDRRRARATAPAPDAPARMAPG